MRHHKYLPNFSLFLSSYQLSFLSLKPRMLTPSLVGLGWQRNLSCLTILKLLFLWGSFRYEIIYVWKYFFHLTNRPAHIFHIFNNSFIHSFTLWSGKQSLTRETGREIWSFIRGVKKISVESNLKEYCHYVLWTRWYQIAKSQPLIDQSLGLLFTNSRVFLGL